MFRLVATGAVAALSLRLLSFSATVNGDPTLTPATVVAEVNGEKITYGEFTEKRAHNLFQARDGFYHQQVKVLDKYKNNQDQKQQTQKERDTDDQKQNSQETSKMPPDPSEEALRVYFE